MIARRQFVASVGTLSAGAATLGLSPLRAGIPAVDVSSLDPLETMIRLRSRTDGNLSISWLDAHRELVIEGEITPFCNFYAFVLTKFRREGDSFAARTVEITYYCDPVTGELLDTVMMPGAKEPVTVPIYRAGPTDVRFKESLDEWERHEPAHAQAASAAFAPPSWLHMVRGVRKPWTRGDELYVRADEYGRAYTDRAKPPSVFYRECMVWKGSARELLDTSNPDVPSDYSYSAASSLRPWMKMPDVQGHTVENGRGSKVATVDLLPAALTRLLQRHDPQALKAPESYFS